MKTLYSFQPAYFNQNGDQANIEVLEFATGAKFSNVLNSSADFVIIGDASRAAMREFEPSLLELVPAIAARFDSGLPTLVIGSSYEFFASKIMTMPTLTYGPRVSAFVEVQSQDQRVVGYQNTELQNPKFVLRGAFIGTVLFGPLLAKNPAVIEIIANALDLQSQLDQKYLDLVEQVRRNLTFG